MRSSVYWRFSGILPLLLVNRTHWSMYFIRFSISYHGDNIFLNQTQWHLFPWRNSCQTFHSWRTVDEHCWKLSLKTAILNWQGWICVNIFYQFGQVKGVIVGNKVHWRILKRAEQENKTQNFPKSKHILPPDSHTCVCLSVGKKCLLFRKIWRAWFSCNTGFEIRLFPLLLTSCPQLSLTSLSFPPEESNLSGRHHKQL